MNSSFSSISSRSWFALLGFGCFALVAAGLGLQEILRLSPCPLCIFQRLLYLCIGGLAVLGLLWPAGQRLCLALIGALAVFGLAVAGYQSWMQAFPELANECSMSDPNLIEQLVDWLGVRWPYLFLATGFCASKEWVFLGLSMANWSLLMFSGIAGLAALLWITKKS
jgi:disulfide bond formation protein DsbB